MKIIPPDNQALERTAPVLPLRPGIPEKRSHDYIRHGTTALFAALEAATGKVTGACYPRHRHEEFLAFLNQVAKAYPRVPLHIVCDNYGTHTQGRGVAPDATFRRRHGAGAIRAADPIPPRP
jgi:DDE superfamily endonuclease